MFESTNSFASSYASTQPQSRLSSQLPSTPETITGVDLSPFLPSRSVELLQPIATVPGQPTKVSAQAMTPMIKKARKPRARDPKEVIEIQNVGYPQVEELGTIDPQFLLVLNDEIKNEITNLRREINDLDKRLNLTPYEQNYIDVQRNRKEILENYRNTNTNKKK